MSAFCFVAPGKPPWSAHSSKHCWSSLARRGYLDPREQQPAVSAGETGDKPAWNRAQSGSTVLQTSADTAGTCSSLDTQHCLGSLLYEALWRSSPFRTPNQLQCELRPKPEILKYLELYSTSSRGFNSSKMSQTSMKCLHIQGSPVAPSSVQRRNGSNPLANGGSCMGKRLGPGQAEDGRFERRPRIAALILWLLYIPIFAHTWYYIYIYYKCSKLELKDSDANWQAFNTLIDWLAQSQALCVARWNQQKDGLQNLSA